MGYAPFYKLLETDSFGCQRNLDLYSAANKLWVERKNKEASELYIKLIGQENVSRYTLGRAYLELGMCYTRLRDFSAGTLYNRKALMTYGVADPF